MWLHRFTSSFSSSSFSSSSSSSSTMQLCLKEYKHKKITVYSLVPLVLFVISLPFWVVGITMYALSVTNWLVSYPSVLSHSRSSLVFSYIGCVRMYVCICFFVQHSPATSRNLNAPCVVLEFYDTHDLWHCFTAFALFFSLLVRPHHTRWAHYNTTIFDLPHNTRC